jgi:hypothetical protein
MPMPKTTVYKDYSPMLGKNKVRLAWQALVVDQIAETLRMKSASDYHLGLSVLAADACHHSASNSSRDDISHKRRLDPVPG